MQEMNLREKMVHYMDAGFPVLYINTFEEDKVDEILFSIRGERAL
ncbi:MAG: hypothetical protein Q4A78_12430 [Peptostreptococcaceae bacterium]|nr:hypothetical protein [Peptostreptococcaceae bacterium]